MLRVLTTNPTGGGFDITPLIDGLSWSSVNPGGDETANFVFKQPWSRNNVEIARGSVVTITDGLEMLWTGRIEEQSRGGDQTEEVAVTAYGLGIRLKENTMVEIYADRDLSAWGEVALAPRDWWRSNGYTYQGGPSVVPDAAGNNTLLLPVTQGQANPTNSAWYKAGPDARVGSIYYEMTSVSSSAYTGVIGVASHDSGGGISNTGDLLTGTNSSATGTFTALLPNQDAGRYAYIEFFAGGGEVPNSDKAFAVKNLVVFGAHGVAKRGTAPNQGFFDSDIVSDVIRRVPGVVARRIDQGSFVITQAAYKENVEHESVISDVSRFENRDWGTFGSDNVLSPTTDGQFDYKLKDTAARQWMIRRSQCASLDLHSEMSTLFDTVVVKYQDVAGTPQTVVRTRPSPNLIAAGASPKTLTLDGGVQTPASAQTLGDVALALGGSFAPARGSVRVDGPIRHSTRGEIPAHFMRADGSNIQISDILPSTTMLALDDTPDRRTTFPIKRVSCDANGNVISTTVELDQVNDVLTQLQNRLSANATRVLG